MFSVFEKEKNLFNLYAGDMSSPMFALSKFAQRAKNSGNSIWSIILVKNYVHL